jgi:uncharacterized surface protein with fasciclin (FAS1) repeats
MPKNKALITLALTAILILILAPVASAQYTPAIFAVDQDVVDGIVRVTRVTSNGPGWVVIHADDGGKPGPVIGYAPVPNGITSNLKVEVDPAAVTPVLHPMLHVDDGAVGEYEFPDADAPAVVNDQIVMIPIKIEQVADSIAGVAEKNGLTTLLAAVEAAEVGGTLARGGPYTVFAPSEEAFAALPEGQLDALLADPDTLSQILTYHVAPGALTSDAITQTMSVPTLQGEDIDLAVADGIVTVNGASVTTADLPAINGVVHIVDQVLVPPSMQEAAATEAAEAAASEPMTETEAMTETVEMTSTEVMTESVEAAASEPMTETEAMTETAEVAPTEIMTESVEAAEPMDIVDTAMAAGGFDTLLAALQAAGLESALRSDGAFTVFAPTDEAFAKIPQETRDALLADPTGALTQVLLYHVLPNAVMSSELSDGQEAPTMQGASVKFTIGDGVAMVNDANVIAADIVASNGVIHVIDSVILPPTAESTEPAAEAAPEAPGELPTTGGSFDSPLLSVVLATLVMVVLAAGALTTRRRQS